MPATQSYAKLLADLHVALGAAGLPSGFLLPAVYTSWSCTGVVHIGGCQVEVPAAGPVTSIGVLAVEGSLCKTCAARFCDPTGRRRPPVAGPQFVFGSLYDPSQPWSAGKKVHLELHTMLRAAAGIAAVAEGRAAAHEATATAATVARLVEHLRKSVGAALWPAGDLVLRDELLVALTEAHARVVASAGASCGVTPERVGAALVTAFYGGSATLDDWGDALVELVGTEPSRAVGSLYIGTLAPLPALDRDGFVSAGHVSPGGLCRDALVSLFAGLSAEASALALAGPDIPVAVHTGPGTAFAENFEGELLEALTQPREFAEASLSARVRSVFAGPVAERVARLAATRSADRMIGMHVRWGTPSEWKLVFLRPTFSSYEERSAVASQAARMLFPSHPIGRHDELVVAVPDWFDFKAAAARFDQSELATLPGRPPEGMLAVFAQLHPQLAEFGSAQALADAAWNIAAE